jgi:hypothetical protein
MKKVNFLSVFSAGMVIATVTSPAFAATPATISSSISTQQMDLDHSQSNSRFHEFNPELLTLLKIDATTLKQEFKAGKSLADIAAAKGIQKQKVIDLLVTQVSNQLEQDVKSGRLTQDQAKQKKAKLQGFITQGVERKGGLGSGHRGHHGRRGVLKDAKSILGLDKQEMMNQLKGGKSLVEIAQSKGISKDQLISKLLERDKERLTKMVEKKWQANDSLQ